MTCVCRPRCARCTSRRSAMWHVVAGPARLSSMEVSGTNCWTMWSQSNELRRCVLVVWNHARRHRTVSNERVLCQVLSAELVDQVSRPLVFLSRASAVPADDCSAMHVLFTAALHVSTEVELVASHPANWVGAFDLVLARRSDVDDEQAALLLHECLLAVTKWDCSCLPHPDDSVPSLAMHHRASAFAAIASFPQLHVFAIEVERWKTLMGDTRLRSVAGCEVRCWTCKRFIHGSHAAAVASGVAAQSLLGRTMPASRIGRGVHVDAALQVDRRRHRHVWCVGNRCKCSPPRYWSPPAAGARALCSVVPSNAAKRVCQRVCRRRTGHQRAVPRRTHCVLLCCGVWSCTACRGLA